MRINIYIVTAVLFLFSSSAGALELGDLNVSSRLGETFSAKVPLTLDRDEEISKLTIELATPNDYRALHVHFDPALRLIRTDIERDRLSNWISLSSRSPINSPVLFLLLKLKHGSAIHFKKYSVFLDVTGTGRPAPRSAAPSSTIQEHVKTAEDTIYLSLDEPPLTEEAVIEKVQTTFKPYDGWARTSQYGPTVYGDTIHTIANRLRIDERYTIKQIMVALFEKNRAKFAEDNLNLPLYGSYLDTPLAEEVERHPYEQALTIIQEHDQQWKELKRQAHYAAVADAQKNRYSKRERSAEKIKAAKATSGMASQTVSDPQ